VNAVRIARALRATIMPLAVRHLMRRRLPGMVAVLGLACGVAAITASQLLYASVVATYEATTLGFAGRATLQVSNGDSGVPEELADELRRVPGVATVAASVEGFVATPDFPGDRLYLYGIDLLADQEVRDYGAGTEAVVSDPMVFLAAPDSVALTSDFMRARALAMHDRLRVLTPAGTVALEVRAALGTQRGPAAVLDGRLAVVDLSVAQDLFLLDRRVSELAITLAPGANVAVVERAVVACVGQRGTVERPRSRAAAFGRLLGNYREGLTLAATVAMLVALALVSNLAMIAVEDRRREIALLRLVGMRAPATATVVLFELFILSLVGTIVGIPLGTGLARWLSGASGAGVAALYADVGEPRLVWNGAAIACSAFVGLVTPLVAAAGSLRRTLNVRPLEALRPHDLTGSIRPPSARGFWLGGGLCAIAVLVWLGRALLPITTGDAATITMLGVTIGAAAALPGVLRLCAVLGERMMTTLPSVVALLASRHVVRDVRRLTVMGSAVVVSLGGAIAIASWISTLDGTLAAAFENVFGRIDLVVSGGGDPFTPEAMRIPAAVADDLATWPEVAFVDPVRVSTIAFADGRAAVVASDARLYRDGRRRLSMVEGEPGAAAAVLASGTGVLVNQVFARRFGRRPGDMLELATPNGPLRVRIAGIHLELTPGDLGTIRMDEAVYRRWWRDETASAIEIALRRDVDGGRVAAAIRARWGADYGLVVLTTSDLRRHYGDLLGRLTGLVYPLLAVALGCASIGVVSAGIATALARRRVTAMFRAIGATRGQVAIALAMESALIGAIAAALAVVIGSGFGWTQVEVLMRGTLGMSVRYAHPLRWAVVGGLAVIAMTSLGGLIIGARAGAAAVGSALQAE
jgi:putative ABC transport system permease protein